MQLSYVRDKILLLSKSRSCIIDYCWLLLQLGLVNHFVQSMLCFSAVDMLLLWTEFLTLPWIQVNQLERQFYTSDVGTVMRTTSMKRNWLSTRTRVSWRSCMSHSRVIKQRRSTYSICWSRTAKRCGKSWTKVDISTSAGQSAYQLEFAENISLVLRLITMFAINPIVYSIQIWTTVEGYSVIYCHVVHHCVTSTKN